MNPQEYIETGALEAYVLGIASAEEAALAERMRADHPEVEEEYQAIAATVDRLAQSYAVPAPEEAWDAIATRIRPEDGASEEESGQAIERSLPSEIHSAPVAQNETASTSGGGRVVDINMPEKVIVRHSRFWQAIAAGLALLAAGSLAANYWQHGQRNTLAQELADARQQNTVLATTASQVGKARGDMARLMAEVADPTMQHMVMKGLKDAPEAKVMVMWKKGSGHMTVAMHHMPAVPADKDLQLWAIVGGKPVDLGIIPARQGELLEHDMPALVGATAFAITLEDKGGHPQPQGVMLTMGEIKS